jgi:hypothetical protein
MDGVLADWVAGFNATFPISYEKFDALPRDKYDAYKDLIENTPNFFANLPAFNKTVADLKKLISDGYDVEIMTSAGKNNTAKIVKQKKVWLKKHGINAPFNYTTTSKEKANFANADTVLIDDREKSTKPFKAAGGNIILHTDGKTNLMKELKKYL